MDCSAGELGVALCLRLFDLEGEPDARAAMPPRFTVERVELRVEGVCAECADYASGITEGASVALSARDGAVHVFDTEGRRVVDPDEGNRRWRSPRY